MRERLSEKEKIARVVTGVDTDSTFMGVDDRSLDKMIDNAERQKWNDSVKEIEDKFKDHENALQEAADEYAKKLDGVQIYPIANYVIVRPFKENPFQKVKIDEKLKKMCDDNGENLPKESIKLSDLLKRNNIDIFKISKAYGLFEEYSHEILDVVNTKVKYEGYLRQQQEDVDKMLANEKVKIPEDFDYKSQKGLRAEAVEKLDKIRPLNLGQASRISGVSPADISVLAVLIKKR